MIFTCSQKWPNFQRKLYTIHVEKPKTIPNFSKIPESQSQRWLLVEFFCDSKPAIPRFFGNYGVLFKWNLGIPKNFKLFPFHDWNSSDLKKKKNTKTTQVMSTNRPPWPQSRVGWSLGSVLDRNQPSWLLEPTGRFVDIFLPPSMDLFTPGRRRNVK